MTQHDCINGWFRKLLAAIALGAMVWAGGGSARAEDAAIDQSRVTVSVQEPARGGTGVVRLTVLADRADITEVLKALFTKIGADYAIDQDVGGAVDLHLRNETFPRILQAVEAVSRPPIVVRVVNGVYRVSLREQTPGAPLRGPMRYPYASLAVANRPVTLEVSEEHPIPLEAALERMSLQTGYIIRLDPRVPRSLMFSGHITQAPLGTVLQVIADTSRLKVVTAGNEVLLVPEDRFLITLGGAAVSGYPTTACRYCGERLLPGWKFCPHCGKPVPSPYTGRPAR